MTDSELITWVITRLVKDFGEHPNCGYILNLVRISKKLDKKESLQHRLDQALDYLERWVGDQYKPDEFVNKDTQELLEKEGRL